jgi:hypothetical protein
MNLIKPLIEKLLSKYKLIPEEFETNHLFDEFRWHVYYNEHEKCFERKKIATTYTPKSTKR